MKLGRSNVHTLPWLLEVCQFVFWEGIASPRCQQSRARRPRFPAQRRTRVRQPQPKERSSKGPWRRQGSQALLCVWGSCHLTWRLPARGYEQMTTVGCSPRVRVHRQVRRRYLWRAASSAMPTKTIATASMTMPTRMSMAIASRFDRYGARYVDGLSRCRSSPEPR